MLHQEELKKKLETETMKTMLSLLLNLLCVVALSAEVHDAANVPRVPRQPLLAQVHRLTEAMDVVGNAFDGETLQQLNALKSTQDEIKVTQEVQRLLDPYCIAIIDIKAEGPPQVTPGPSENKLLEQGWRTFLVKVINKPGRTGRLLVESPNAAPLPHAPQSEVESRWMQLSSYEGQPMRPNLGGLELEYRIIQIYSRDAGPKSALLEFNVSHGSGTNSELIREWRFDKDTDGWQAINQCEITSRDGALDFTSTGEDPFIAADITEAYVAERCADGDDVELRLVPGAEHFTLTWRTADEAVAWTEDRLEGEPTAPTCPV